MSGGERIFHPIGLVAGFVGTTLAANAVIVGSLSLLIRLVFPPHEFSNFQALDDQGWIAIGNVISFGTPAVCIGLYLLPLLRVRTSSPERLLVVARSRLLNAPLVLGLIGCLGWFLGVGSGQIILRVLGMPTTTVGTIRTIVQGSLLALFCFVLVYYSIELISRRFYVPRLFPDGGLSEAPGVHRLSIRRRFIIFFFAVCLLPVLLLGQVLVAQISPERLADVLLPGAAFFGVLLVMAGILTSLVSGSYQAPLEEMKATTERIRAGDYTARTTIRSADEVGYLGEALNEMARGLEERDFIMETFGRVVDPSVRDHLLSGNVRLGGELLEATILFSDIRDFTRISEKLPPEEVVRLLNRHFERVSRCITEEQGLVNKFIGDAIMAVFGAPVVLPDQADRALRAAQRMLSARAELNAELAAESLPTLETGIGIHTGLVLAGNIGSEARMEYTVIGDAVNVASRLESLCKELGTDLLVSGATHAKLSGGFATRFVRNVVVRGRMEEIPVFTIAPEEGREGPGHAGRSRSGSE